MAAPVKKKKKATVAKSLAKSLAKNLGKSLAHIGSDVNQFEKVINISNGQHDVNNYILPIIVHRGSNNYDITSKDVYLYNACKKDFSDIAFTDADDNQLESYLHSHGNYEFVQTKFKGGNVNLFDSFGNIYTSALQADGLVNSNTKLYKSSDNGETWIELYLCTTGYITPLFIDSRDYIYFSCREDNGVYRSIDYGLNFSKVLDMSDVVGYAYINTFGIDEATNGDLYAGRYQLANDAQIFKSSDSGATWVNVWTDKSVQHVHGLRIDKITGYIYAGIDGTPFPLIRSIDSGATWTRIYTGQGGNATGIICGDGFRLFAAESPQGVSMLRTTDDVTFTNVFMSDYTIKSLRYIDGVCYATGSIFNRMYYPALFRSIDDGLTWETIWISRFDRTPGSEGYNNNFIDFNIANGDDTFMTMADGRLIADYPVSRIYHGNNHYQALFYVKIPILSTAGASIKVKNKSSSTSNKTIFDYVPTDNLLLRYKFNEGTGLNIFDSSGNGRHGTLRAEGIGSWNIKSIKRAGALYPEILQDRSSYKFSATDRFNSTLLTVTGSGTDAALQMINNFTIVSWVKIPYPYGGPVTIAGKGRYANLAWAFGYSGTFGTIIFTIGNKTIRTQISSSDAPLHPSGVNNYPWVAQTSGPITHMIGVVVDSEVIPNIRFFIDGNLLLSQPLPHAIGPNTSPVVIGCEAPEGVAYTVGDIDDLLIYNRQLTEIELRSIYEGMPLLPVEPVIT